jgi:hypothetical protein
MGDCSGTQPRLTNAHSALDIFSDVENDDEDDPVLNDLEEVITWETPAVTEAPAIMDEELSPISSEEPENNDQKRAAIDSATKKTKKLRKKQSTNKPTPLLDDRTISLFTTSSSDLKMEETVRHNKAMEKAKFEEVAILSWKGKSDATNYKMQLIDQYEKLIQKGYSKTKIIRLFPEMKAIAETMEATDSDSSV